VLLRVQLKMQGEKPDERQQGVKQAAWLSALHYSLLGVARGLLLDLLNVLLHAQLGMPERAQQPDCVDSLDAAVEWSGGVM